MTIKEDRLQPSGGGINDNDLCSTASVEKVDPCSTPYNSTDNDGSLEICRVCQCAESDRRGDAALVFLDITPPLKEVLKNNEDDKSTRNEASERVDVDAFDNKNCGGDSGFIEFISPEGEVFICRADLEAGPHHHRDALMSLGCSCKNDLSLAHYACALKWFISHGSTICEICSSVAKNVSPADFKKVVASLKDYEALRERTATGNPSPALVQTLSGIDPDAVAAIRRQRLSEISLWFTPLSNSTTVPEGVMVQASNIPTEDVIPTENPRTKWAVEITGILVATGLLTVTLAWLIAPSVGKKKAKTGLHILIGGLCALTIVIFLRFIVLSRIKYGPARYWAILFVFWFLVFGIWASRTHEAHTT